MWKTQESEKHTASLRNGLGHPSHLWYTLPCGGGVRLISLRSECAKGAAKASCGETVVQKGVFGESVSSLPP